MKDFKINLDNFKRSNPISSFYEFGMTPEDIKSSIVETFELHFKNRSNLEKFATSDLVGTWLSYMTLSKDHSNLLVHINEILSVFNDAKQINESQTIEAYQKWLPDLYQSISRFWSLYNNQNDILSFCTEDFLEEALRIIGQSIEGLSKSFLKLLLHLNRIRRNKIADFAEIQSKDLGVVIDELISTSNLKDLLIIQPNNIRLNQWRNIAYHHNSRIVDGKIFYSIQRNGITEEFNIEKKDLFEIVKRILAIFRLMRIAETIFCIDNIHLLSSVEESQLNIRDESKLVDFYTSLSSQGFTVTDLNYDNEFAKLDVQDMDEYGDLQKRAIHSSQYLFNLWIFTGSFHLKVNYFLFNGEKFFSSEIDANSFKKYSGVKTELSKLMKDVKYSFISTEYRQNKDPFSTLKISNKIKRNSHKFYSQAGSRITAEVFTKQFTLNVFCNYLVLRSEGFNEIKISIGSDGSLAITDNPKSLLLHVPAVIKNKELQGELIRLLGEMIDLYDKMLLKKDLVDEAKMNNKYYFKKHLIREQLVTKELGSDKES